jgi:hypothetical protein
MSVYFVWFLVDFLQGSWTSISSFLYCRPEWNFEDSACSGFSTCSTAIFCDILHSLTSRKLNICSELRSLSLFAFSTHFREFSTIWASTSHLAVCRFLRTNVRLDFCKNIATISKYRYDLYVLPVFTFTWSFIISSLSCQWESSCYLYC